MNSLNPDQFFHGTTSTIKDGVVRPADDVGKNVSEYSMGDPGDMSEGDHAFVSKNDENYAWHAASPFHVNGNRPKVYETGPADDMKPGPWNKEHPDFLAHNEINSLEVGGVHYEPDADEIADAHSRSQPEWASKTGFPVRNRIDIMPGRQGTFPSVNWNQYRAIGRSNGTDVVPTAPRNQDERREALRQPMMNVDTNHPTDTAIATPLSEQFQTAKDKQIQGGLIYAHKAAENKVVEYGLRGKTRNRVLPIVPGNKRLATLLD